MDLDTLKALQTALEVSPDNVALRLTVVRSAAALEEAELALSSLSPLIPDMIDKEEDRLFVAGFLAGNGSPQAALEWLKGQESPEAELLLARVLLSLEREEEARDAYARAITGNAALQDRTFEESLERKVLRFPGGSRTTAAVAVPPGHNRESDSDEDALSAEIVMLVAPQEKRVTFSDVGGLDDVKKLIHRKIISPFEKPSLFARFKKKAGGGILLYGPPGVGKTLLARATAGECNATFFNIEISDILDMWQGESERKLHALFEAARQRKPSVIFFDEIEALGARRRTQSDSGSSHLVSQFLSEMDGFAQDNEGVLIIGASNVPWSIDSAFRRPGRFDRVIFVPPPDRPARAAILEAMLQDRPQAEAINTAKLADQSSGFSGADLKNLVETAIDIAIEESIDAEAISGLTNKMLREALKEVRPTTLEWLTTARNYARYSNESGQYNDVLDFLGKHGR
jgi:AAA+ superfamily predicted ATPase